MKEVDQHISLIGSKAATGSYRFSPYREKLILKGADSPPRKISIPTIRDRVTLRCLNNFLCQIFSDCKPPHAHPIVSSTIQSFKRAEASDSFIKLDVKGFYDHINHDVLFRQLRKRIRHKPAMDLIISAVKTPTGARVRDKLENNIGVPQGLSISNILASIYMLDVDIEYETRLDIDYHRYVDDILVRSPSIEASILANDLSRRLKQTRKLTTHPIGAGKSAIHPFGETVSYLGYTFNRNKVSVRDASIKKMMTSLMRIISGINDSNVEKSIWRLNLRVSGCRIQGGNVGWLFYFSQINDHRVLFRLDKQIEKRLAKVGRPELYARCKNFVKAHREIRENFKNTSYVFDFDTFSRNQQLEAIYLIKPETDGKFDRKTDNEVRSIFFRTMYREAREMERDTLGSFS
ncbi:MULTISPECIES: reverse transcriptase domain-containing protein [Celeribacter]|uniref:reverse transcriptase domain-containing protein n=1 Tax=Celeribacter TaxID=875170 RepID=UPI003A953D92